MMGPLRAFTDRLMGRGSAALTVPPLDGALKPNNRLEEAPGGIAATEPGSLVVKDGRVLWAEGSTVMSQAGPVADAAGTITAIAVSAAGSVAIAAQGQGVRIDGAMVQALAGLSCVTALAYEGEQTLWIAVGSTVNPITAWSRDFLEMRRSGQVLRFDIGNQRLSVVTERLAFPFGLLPVNGGVVVSESWARRLILLGGDGKIRQLTENLPGYPAGLAPSSTGGGTWLALFAPCNPLLELVLREPEYRRAMMAEVDSEFWIAPALRSGYSFLEPMQGGALKQMGILKPWAPTRSYGLVVELNADFVPVQSLHSRAGGRRHGITSVLEHDSKLWVAAKGGNEVLCLEPDHGER
jgi:hypothetical protein